MYKNSETGKGFDEPPRERKVGIKWREGGRERKGNQYLLSAYYVPGGFTFSFHVIVPIL